jgi:competence protein ComEC
MIKPALILLILGVILVIRIFSTLYGVHPYRPGQLVSVITTIQNQPQLTQSGQKVSLIMPNYQHLSVTFAKKPTLSYGDRVAFQGEVKYFTTENGKDVAYMTHPQFRTVSKARLSPISSLRNRLVGFFNKTLKPADSSLVLGIVFGVRGNMPEHFYENLRKTGLLHVIAASGMNITMAAGFFMILFGQFLKRQNALFLSIFGIFLYTMLAGFQPSIVRAAIMGILVFTSQILGRQNSAGWGVILAGFVMLFINPALILDVGFQLSFMATIGLIYINPLFYRSKKIERVLEKSIVGGDGVTTISAQIITLPILVTTFGTYSPISILVNVLTLWTIPVLMLLGAGSAFLGLVFEPLGAIMTYLMVPILAYFETVVNFFGNRIQPYSLENIPISLVAGYYLSLLAILVYFRRRD